MSKEQLKFLDDPSFAEKFIHAESAEDVQALFKEHGVDIPMSDLEAMRVDIAKAINEKYGQGELSDDAMEAAAGGFFGSVVKWLGKTVAEKVVDIAVDELWNGLIKPKVEKWLA